MEESVKRTYATIQKAAQDIQHVARDCFIHYAMTFEQMICALGIVQSDWLSRCGMVCVLDLPQREEPERALFAALRQMTVEEGQKLQSVYKDVGESHPLHFPGEGGEQ